MTAARPFRFGVTADRTGSAREWTTWCRKVEDLGFASVAMPDHLGDQCAPLPALAAAAIATNLRLGAMVACNDFRHPVVHAKELATLDVLSEGRVDWGIGAGWLAPEYHAAGIAFDPPRVRVDRLEEAVRLMKRLFAPGATDFHGAHYTVTSLDGLPKPVQQPHPPLIIGGARRRMLTLAAREAQTVSVLPDPAGRMGQPGRPPAITENAAADRQIAWIRQAAHARETEIEINMVAFPAIVTDDPQSRAEEVAPHFGLDARGMLSSPHVWIGTLASICDELEARRERWGVTYWVVPGRVVDAVAPVVARLAGR
jgi:probable F420-dependent oxidoreductase